ncbi:MAG: hypothetical protein AB7K09_09310 [Planctomycetota bacterium]
MAIMDDLHPDLPIPTGASHSGRPPLDDFLGYLDGTLDGSRRADFEQYLSRNREARRRLRHLAKLDEKLQEGLVIESILADARARMRPPAAVDDSSSDSSISAPAPDLAFDETLVAAWIDGALTREERAELQRRLVDPHVAVEFYRQASTARRATDRRTKPDHDSGGSDSAISTVNEYETTEMPAVKPAKRDSGVRISGAATDGSNSNWLGRLLIHSGADSVWVLDASPTDGERPAVAEPEPGKFVVVLPFEGLDLHINIQHAYRGVELRVAAAMPAGKKPPAQFVLTDEAGRRLHRTDGDATEPATLPPLRPGVYRLMAPPLPVNVLVCVNGEMGTTEIHQLLGRPR